VCHTACNVFPHISRTASAYEYGTEDIKRLDPQTTLPTKVEWPRRQLPDLSWLSGIVTILSFAVALFLVGVTQLSLAARVGILLGSLVVPVLILMIWKNGAVAWKRLRQYDELHTSAERYEREAGQLRSHFASLMEVLISAGLRTFAVVNLTTQGNNVLLVIDVHTGDEHVGHLRLGSRVMVVDYLNLDTLGQFEIVRHTTQGYFAREVEIINAVWWGLLHEEASRHARPQINAVAILLPDTPGGI
jgi:hypothetical protein